MNIVKATVAALSLSVMAVPAVAQVNAGNLVSVNITATNVANNLAQNLSVDVADVIDIGSVQVPVGIAANVCNVAANVLAAGVDQNGAAAGDCTASNTSDALTRIVQRNM